MHSRPEMIVEIKFLIHMLFEKGTYLSFCWIPSHRSFYFNDKVDRAARLDMAVNQNVWIFPYHYMRHLI